MTRRLRLLIRLRPVLRFIKQRILHTDDSPQRIARGVAVGLFSAWLPFFGLHLILALIFAAILRANKVMAVLFVWVSNPLTAPFIYYPCYRVGRFFLAFFRDKPVAGPDQIEDIFTEMLTIKRVCTEFFTLELWKQIWDLCLNIGLEMLIGGIVLGLIVAKINYWLCVTLIASHRRKRAQRQSQLTDSAI